MLNSLVVDGVTYTLVIGVKRRSIVTSSDNSGTLLDGTYYNDVIGTYLQYEISVAIPAGEEDTYASLYEVLTNPVAYHDFVFPYNNTSVLVRGRVSDVGDAYMQKNSLDKVTWRQIAFTVTESLPHKTASGGYTPVVPPNAYITASAVDEHLIFTIVDCDYIHFSNNDESLQITYT